ncbi:MAG: glycoside hydrolase [Bacteroidales bacterium]|nr:glycoside hydrolase [Bacteroidales bacterium]
MRKYINVFTCILLLCLSALKLSADAKYEWGSLPLGGGGFVSGIIAHPTEENLFYARTDVGGIYRWIEESQSWKPLTDWISEDDKGLFGIESIAVDPQKPGMLYALAGINYFSGGKTVIMISEDYGESFKIVDVSSKFKTHGNGDGRQMGERLAVDPNNSNVIYCGTRSNGLYKSTDGGLTWNSVGNFPVTNTSNGVGVIFVQFDESSAVSDGVTQKIYVGTAQTGSSIYVSNDGGKSWSAVTGQPTQFMPHRCAMKDGVLYVTYANGAGPGISTAGGCVYKYNGSWTDISPSKTTSDFSYGGISVVGNRIVVTTVGCYRMQAWDGQCDWVNDAYGDEMFVSENLGSSWTQMFQNCKVKLDDNSIPWVYGHAMHWTGCAVIDPKNQNRAFFISGNGLFMTENLNTEQIDLKFMVNGLEETVPLDIVCLPEGQIITVVGDYDGGLYSAKEGFYSVYPTTVHTPEMGTTHGVAASVDGSLVVRAGSSSPYVQYSIDQGKTWQYCSTGNEGSGHVAVSADGSVILHCPNAKTSWGSFDNTASAMYYSTDRGSSWKLCSGVSVSGAYPVADGKDPNTFYVSNGSTIYVSTDGGKNFSAKGSIGSSSYYKIRAVPGVAGDVWAPCGYNGLYRSTNSATTFSKLASVSMCEAVGFGKAATGKDFPAVYIWGTVDGVTGLFRSVDEGQSWIRINDDEHQFGGPGNGQFVVGDMAVFGTVFMSTVGRGVIFGVTDGDETPVETETQTIALKAGWNMISLCVEPEEKYFASVLSGLDFDIVKNNEGFYHTEMDAEPQSLSEIVPGEGYLIYMNSAETLTIEGLPLKNYVSNLVTGWNLIGVPQNKEKQASDFPSTVKEIRDLSGNKVSLLQPGKAYFIQVSANTQIEW